MDAFGNEQKAGTDRTEAGADVEATDNELRKLLAPLAVTPLLTKEEEDAALARLRATIDNRQRTKGEKPIP